MTNFTKAAWWSLVVSVATIQARSVAGETPPKLQPIPDGLVVLTFDDGNKSDITNVAPILERYGFGATFFITEGLGAVRDKKHFLTWGEVKKLNDDGFEIGNHTRSHSNIGWIGRSRARDELVFIQEKCVDRGIPAPVSFCYPGFTSHSRMAVSLLDELGFQFARRGVSPEFPDWGHGGRGPAYDPQRDHPLLLPVTGYAGPDFTFEDLEWTVDQARDGKIAVLCFHGVPGPLHPWVSEDLKTFERYMKYLKDRNATVIAQRDLAKYVDPARRPERPYRGAYDRMADRFGSRIVWIGDTLSAHARRHGYVEAALISLFPDREITFRNLGRAGDAATGEARAGFGPHEVSQRGWVFGRNPIVEEWEDYGFQKLMKQVRAEKPDTVFIAYGSRAAHADEAGMDKFRRGILRLVDEFETMGVRVVLVTPIPYEQLPPPFPDVAPRNARLREASNILGQIARKRRLSRVDLFRHFGGHAKAPQDGLRFTDNGIHLSADGYRAMAAVLERDLGIHRPEWRVRLTSAGDVQSASGTRVEHVQTHRKGLSFRLADERLPRLADPMPERVLEIKDLDPGTYSLTADGRRVTAASHTAWAEGVRLTRGPEFDQAEKLRRAIVEKSRLYFHHFHPQNETYIYLFRSYERGHEKAEIDEFGRLALEKDKEIAALRSPRPRRYELVRDKDYPDHEVPRSVAKPDVDAELKAFTPIEGFQVNLFASDPLVTKPINLNVDARGRLWVSMSTTYPHLAPGDKPNDKIVILEDVDQDGRADKSTVFADELLVPHSVLPADGGAYVAQATDLLFLEDTDGDDRADRRTVLFSGFGNDDVHHMIHGLRRGPAGHIYFSQSLFIHSYVETPWGPRRLNAAGIWRLHRPSMRLEVHARGLGNPWGHAFDRWGQEFQTEGAGGGGLCYIFPGSVHVAAYDRKRHLRKFGPRDPNACGLEFASGTHLPESWRDNVLTTDFKGNRVIRYELSEDGSGYDARRLDDVLASTHPSFRPVDVKMGPDGAIYVVDWYNPIIDHGEVDFHHRLRDRYHGRIWRVTAKDRPLAQPPKIIDAPIGELLEALTAPALLTRLHAKEEMSRRPAGEVGPALRSWVAALDTSNAEYENRRLEALWSFQWLGVVESPLLEAVLKSKDHRARAAAVRVLSYWRERVDGAMSLLAAAVEDPHPQVRLEAVNALRQAPSLEAVELAMRVVDHPMDAYIDFSAWSISREHKQYWVPVLTQGKTVFEDDPKRLGFAAAAARNLAALEYVATSFELDDLSGADRHRIFETLAEVGGRRELTMVLDFALEEAVRDPQHAAVLLATLAASAKKSGEDETRTPTDAPQVVDLLGSSEPKVRRSAADLAGLWGVKPARDKLTELAGDAALSRDERFAAAHGLVRLEDVEFVKRLATSDRPATIRAAAVAAWAKADLREAAPVATLLLSRSADEADALLIFTSFIDQKLGAETLAKAIEGKTLSASIARAGQRAADASGRDLSVLVTALATAGSLGPVSVELSAEEIPPILAAVHSRGSEARGEKIFRREELACLKCHAVGGAGGLMGPDLASLGTSAQLDYVLESLLAPSAKIKDGYRSTTVVVNDGTIVTGFTVRNSPEELVLRDAEGRSHSINPEAIAQIHRSQVSLMPVGLVASLPRDELVDLVKFLSALGKEEGYKVTPQRLVRRWQVLSPDETLTNAAAKKGTDVFAEDDGSFIWKPAYSTVAGSLPLSEYPTSGVGGDDYVATRFQLVVSAAGRIGLRINQPRFVEMWTGSKKMKAQSLSTVELPTGTHTVVVAVNMTALRRAAAETKDDPPSNAGHLAVELVDVPGSPARARLVAGK